VVSRRVITLLTLTCLASGCHLVYPYGVVGVDALDGAIAADARDTGPDAGPDAGWRLLVALNPAVDGCPKPWTYFASIGGCGVAMPSSCTGNTKSVHFSATGSYREIRGRLRGLQYKSTDAFSAGKRNPTIDTIYVDGVSITLGTPRRHLWTYASGLNMYETGPTSCPCVGGDAPPLFVGAAWTCDSGNPDSGYSAVWYTKHPLWDADTLGTDCTPAAKPGWFEVQLAQATTDAIEVRILFDGCDENVAITALELQVR
jgi:hypothetical protein